MVKMRLRVDEISIPVSEIFLSIQGEGPYLGCPAVFLRTHYCNLSCTWCDTGYTWLNQESSKEGIHYFRMDMRSLENEITSYRCSHLVVTGGEPLLHQHSLSELLLKLKTRGFFVEVETNGTIKPTRETIEHVDSFNVSPKTSNSGMPERARIREESLRTFSSLERSWFKFVICAKEDLVEVEEFIHRFSIAKEKVILMPEGTDPETLRNRGLWLAEECKARGYRFGPRLHIILYGNRRGV